MSTLRRMEIETPLGPMTLVSNGSALTRAFLASQPAPRLPAIERGSDGVLERAREQLREYFAGARARFELPLAPEGTAFQRDVWDALVSIAHGETTTYAALARSIGRPSASRAVGNANRLNPIAIVVPCHRVIGSDGSLVGYAGGLRAKEWLLAHERALLATTAA